MNERELLLKRVQVCDFALNDAALFLDTHPDDQEALNFHKKYLKMRKEAAKEFTSRYGPLTRADSIDENRWAWVDEPWPWEREEA